MKILIADDSELIRNSLKKLLISLDDSIQILEAESISKTLKMSQAYHPELLILDIMFPDGNGMDALKKIKLLNSSQKVMILTNYPTQINRLKCIDLGGDYFFDKSDDFDDVFNIVNELVKKYKEKI